MADLLQKNNFAPLSKRFYSYKCVCVPFRPCDFALDCTLCKRRSINSAVTELSSKSNDKSDKLLFLSVFVHFCAKFYFLHRKIYVTFNRMMSYTLLSSITRIVYPQRQIIFVCSLTYFEPTSVLLSSPLAVTRLSHPLSVIKM